MSDLICRQAAIDAIERAKQNIHHNIERAIGDAVCEVLDAVENGIKQLPPIQPEIIYCKDCGHRDDHGCCKYWKGLSMGEIPIATDDYDFCNHARRKEREH